MNNLKNRVFISSTIYDLIDIRAELEKTLKELGLSPIMSDSVTSDGFEVHPDSSSIETCLSNVRSSSYMIVILSKRYGPSLNRAGYPDISATHLEYKEAKVNKIPIYMYVRNRLEGDYRVWKKNSRESEIKLTWVESKDIGLLKLLDEHQDLMKAQTDPGNWFQPFVDSVDLKQLVKRDLRLPAMQYELRQAIESNRMPIMHGQFDFDDFYKHISSGGPHHEFKLNFNIFNYGTVPAYNISAIWHGDSTPFNLIILPTGQSFKISLETHTKTIIAIGIKRKLEVKYQTHDGHWIIDTYEMSLHGQLRASNYFKLVSKVYRIGDELPLIIEQV